MTNCGAISHLLKFLGHIWKTLGMGKFCDARVGSSTPWQILNARLNKAEEGIAPLV